jgi:hypothetical protein
MTIQHYHLFSTVLGDVVEELEYRKTPFSYKTANGLVPFDEFVKYNTGQ